MKKLKIKVIQILKELLRRIFPKEENEENVIIIINSQNVNV